MSVSVFSTQDTFFEMELSLTVGPCGPIGPISPRSP